MHEMCQAKNASKAADFVKDFEKNPSDFPELLETLNRSALRFHSYNEHWMKVEEKFFNQKEILSYQVEYLLGGLNYDPALSIIKRHDLLSLGYITKPELLEEISPYFAQPPKRNFSYIENDLFIKDDFLPTEEILNVSGPGHYAKLSEFGINPDTDVIWVDDLENEAFTKVKEDILGAKCVGIDTENRFNLNKFENWEICLVQIATPNKIYLFDLLKVGDLPAYNDLIKDLLQNEDILKVKYSVNSFWLTFLDWTVPYE